MFSNFKKGVSVAGLCFVLCFVLVTVPVVQVVNAKPSTLVVPDAYSTIQNAIDNADDGDTVYVKSGFYTETLVINKSISLVGEDKESTTIYRGNSSTGHPTIVVQHDGVNITGFTLKNELSYILFPYNVGSFSAHYGAISGIHLLHVENCNIYENLIVNCGCGVWFFGSQYNNVFDNTIMNSSYGLVVSQSQNNFIEGNEFSLCYSALLLTSSSFNVLKNNIMTNNSYSFDVSATQLVHYNNDVASTNLVDGKKIYYFFNLTDTEISPEYCPAAAFVFLVNCNNVSVNNLNLTNGGVWLVNSSSSVLTNNEISGAQLGIWLSSCCDITVSNNALSLINGTAVLLEYSDRILIDRNSVEYTNLYGIRLVSSTNNNLTRNLLMENIGYAVLLEQSHQNNIVDNVLSNSEIGISLSCSAETSIKNNKIFSYESETQNLTRAIQGIRLRDNCDKSEIIANTILNYEDGLNLDNSVYISVIGNNITNCGRGLFVNCKASTFASNTICNSREFDVMMYDFYDYYFGLYNTFYNNNFINNAHQTNQSILNDWVYGSNGNYWSNYNGADLNGDGIGDTPHVLDDKNQDIYPLIAPIERFDVGTWGQNNYYIDLATNSVVTNFVCNPDQEASIKFNVDVQTGNHSFCRVTIPKDFMDSHGNWVVLVNDEPVSLTVTEETDNTFLNFTYDNTAHSVEIIGTTSIPEFPSWTVLPLFLISSLALCLCQRKLSKTAHN